MGKIAKGDEVAASVGLFEEAFALSVERLSERIGDSGAVGPASRVIASFSMVPGKHLRPLLFLHAYKLFSGGREPDEALLGVACAQEHFHNFLLIHDDVIDRSTSRRGRPTVHEALRTAAGVNGENAGHVAIILGNVLYSYALEAFAASDLPREAAAEGLRYFLEVAADTGLGETRELLNLERPLEAVTEAEILETYDLKTSRYTFEAPLVLAAIFADRSTAEVRAVLRAMTRPIGIAFQIENDLHEIELEGVGASDLAYDLKAGIKTLFLKRAVDALVGEERAWMEDFLVARQPTDEQCREALRRLRASPVRAKVRALVEAYFEESREVLAAANIFDPRERAGLGALLSFIHSRRKHSEADRTPAYLSAAG